MSSLAKILSRVQITGATAIGGSSDYANNILILDGNGKISTIALPPIAITHTYVAASNADRNALPNLVTGDFVKVTPGANSTEANRSYILSSGTGSNDSDWLEVGDSNILATNVSFTPTGALTSTNVGDAINELDTVKATNTALTAHTSNTSNPHNVTKAQVGLGNVENTALSTWPGTTNITTLGTIASGTWNGTAIADTYVASSGTWNAHIANLNNPHNVTKAQIGLSNVTNDAQLTAAQLSVDGTLAADSDANIASQKAVKTYVDSKILKTVIYATKAGCACDGVTDDTLALQAVLNNLATNGGGELVIDGNTVISDVTIDWAQTNPGYQTTALMVGSNTRIRVLPGFTVKLANNSNCAMLGNNINGSSIVTNNIEIVGGIWDGNDANQTFREDGHLINDSGWNAVFGFWFGGFQNLVIRDLKVANAKVYSIVLSNGSNFFINNVESHWSAPGSNTDGLHLYGTLDRGDVIGYTSNGADDSLALNTNEGVYIAVDQGQAQWRLDRFPQSGGELSNFTFENIYFNSAKNGVRFIGYGPSGTPTLSNIVFHRCYGNITTVPMQNSGVTGDYVEFDSWNVSGNNAIDVSGFTSVRLEGINGVSVTDTATTVSGDHFLLTSDTSGNLTAPHNLTVDGNLIVNSDVTSGTWQATPIADTYVASAGTWNAHIANLNNPHQVTKAQVGLSNVTNDAQLTAAQLSTDGTLSADLDTNVPSQKAVKTYVDGKIPNTVIYASKSGCALNSNISTGGGTNDTTAIQNALNALSSAGGGTWVQDGVSLITGIAVPSNIAIVGAYKGCGFYLANGSNATPIHNVHRNMDTGGDHITPTNIQDFNIRIENIIVNANQANNTNDPNDWTCGIDFNGIDGLILRDCEVRESIKFAFRVTNFQNVLAENLKAYWATPQVNDDGFHMNGPGKNIIVRNLWHNGDDDAVGINTDETYLAGGTSVYVTYGGISDVLIDGVYCNDSNQGVRVLNQVYRSERITIKNVYGTIGSYAVNAQITFNQGAGNVGCLTIEDINVGIRSAGSHYGNTNAEPVPYWNVVCVDLKADELIINNVTSEEVKDGRPILYAGNTCNVTKITIDGTPSIVSGNSFIDQIAKTNVVAQYTLQGTLDDSSGNGNTLTNSNGVTFIADSSMGGQAASFNNTLDQGLYKDARLFVQGESVTYSAWIKFPDSTATTCIIVGSWNHLGNNVYGCQIAVNSNSTLEASYFASGVLGQLASGTVTLLDGKAHWVGARFNQDTHTVDIWLDGAKITSGSFTGTLDNNGFFEIGQSEGDSTYFHGEISYVQAWNIAKSDQDMMLIYNDGVPALDSGKSFGRIVYASDWGCALDSNIDTGGGTDDTAKLQSALDYLHAIGGGKLIIDGVALVSNALVNNAGNNYAVTSGTYNGFTVYKGALIVRSDTEIHFLEGSGLYLANNSDCHILSTDLSGATVTNKNISITGFPVLNCNDANQAKTLANQVGGAAPWVTGVYFGSLQYFYIENLLLRNAKTFALVLSNAYNGKIVNTKFHWDNTSLNNNPNQNRDGLHFLGPCYDIDIAGIESNGDDDVIALNTDENTDAGDPYRGSYTDNDIYGHPLGALVNITINKTYFNNSSNGIRLIGYGHGSQNVQNVRVIDCYGKITYVHMTSVGVSLNSFELNGWHVTQGVVDTINGGHTSDIVLNGFVAGGILRLENIDSGISVATDAPIIQGDSGAGGNIFSKLTSKGALSADNGSILSDGSGNLTVTKITSTTLSSDTNNIHSDGSGNLTTKGLITGTGGLVANNTVTFTSYVSGLLKTDASGNVGVATANTDYLPVSGAVATTSLTLDSYAILYFGSNGVSSGYIKTTDSSFGPIEISSANGVRFAGNISSTNNWWNITGNNGITFMTTSSSQAFRFQYNGSNVIVMSSTGSLALGSTTEASASQLLVIPAAISTIGTINQGMSGQTGDLEQWQANGGGVLAKIDSAGNFTTTGTVTTAINSAKALKTDSSGKIIDSGDLFVYKAADTTVNSNTTLTNDPDLQVTLQAGKIYKVRVELLADTGVGGISTTMNFTGTANWNRALGSYGTTNTNWSTYPDTSVTGFNWVRTTADFHGSTLDGIISVNTSGVLSVQFAQQTSDVSNTTMLTSSYISAKCLN